MKKLVMSSVLLLLVLSGQANAADVWYDVVQYWNSFSSVWYEATQ